MPSLLTPPATEKTRIINLVRHANLKAFTDFLKTNKYDLNFMEGSLQFTPLLVAASTNNLEFVQKLIEYGANPNYSPPRITPLMSASLGGFNSIVNHLIKKKADVNTVTPYGFTALYYAICNNHINIIKTLIKHGADVNFLTPDGDHLILKALDNKQYDVVKILLEAGGKPTGQNIFGHNCYQLAMKNRYFDLLEQLPKIEPLTHNQYEEILI